MKQIATVEQILENGRAEIAVPRKSACGHDCEECAGCGVSGASVRAVAENPIGARVGQKVVVESNSQRFFGIAAIVYLLPLAFFLLGYFCSAGLSESVRSVIAVASFLAGLLPAVYYDRRLRKQGGLTFTIVQLM